MRVDVREQVAVAMSVRGQLGESGANTETMMGALAAADDLGRALWRMRYGEVSRRAGMDRAVALLTKRVRALGPKRRTGLRDHSPAGSRELGADVFTLMARRAVWEWLGDRCGECHGAIVGEIQDATHPLGGRLFCCIACGGTGRRRYPDAERAGALRLPVEVYRRNWARQFAAVLAMLDRFDGDTERRVRQQLAPVAQSKNVA